MARLYQLAVGCWWVVGLLAAQGYAGLTPVDPAQFFVAPEREAVLEWKIEPADARVGTAFTIRDYESRAVTQGEAMIHEGRVAASVKLAPGYYEISIGAQDERFGICVLPERRGAADPFFCVDSAWSWLEQRGAVRGAMARVLRRVGVACSRERLGWGEIQPEGEKWDWQAAHRYEELREVCTRHGLPVLEMFHSAPGWMGATAGNRYPADLGPAAEAWATIAGRWRKHWAALEVWNEPDIFFGSDLPGDQYVAVVKAVAYGLRDVSPAVPLVGGVFTEICPDEYRRACALNGLLDNVDAISFHSYRKADTMQGMVQTYRDWLKAAKVESMPLWITECGRPWQKGPARPPADQDSASALDITMKGAEARACGVAAYFPFISVYFEENANNFGMMGKEVTPLRSMAAYAQAITALAGKPYRGDLVTTDPVIQRARVFGDDQGSVVVLYTGQAKSGAKVRVDLPFDRLEGIDGRVLSAADGGSVPIPDGLTYVWVDSVKVGAALKTDTDAARLYAMSRRPPPHRAPPATLILQHRFDPKLMAGTARGYTISPEAARRFTLRVGVHNLSKEARRTELTLTSGTETAPAEVAPPRVADVPAGGLVETTWELDLQPYVDRAGACTLVVSGRADGGEWVSPLAVEVHVKSEVAATQPGR